MLDIALMALVELAAIWLFLHQVASATAVGFATHSPAMLRYLVVLRLLPVDPILESGFQILPVQLTVFAQCCLAPRPDYHSLARVVMPC